MEANNARTTPCQCFGKTQQIWQKYLTIARNELARENWEQAAAHYAMASNCAEKLLAFKQERCLEGFLRTSMEFLFAIRKSDYPVCIDNFVAVVNAKIENFLAHNPTDRPLVSFTIPLNDIAYAPLAEVEHWMLVLTAMEQSRDEIRH